MTATSRLNPYIAGSPVTGAEMFFGRADVFEFVRRHLIGRHRDSPIVLYGQRRSGKTSILYQLQRHLDPAYRCVIIDLHGMQFGDAGALLHGIATAVSRALAQQVPCAVPVPDLVAFVAQPLSTFEDRFLDDIWAALGSDHLVLLVDEAVRLNEEVAAGHLDRAIFEYLRHLIQSCERLTFVFSISNGLEEMQKDYAFLFSSSLYHRISFLDRSAARELITGPVDGLYEVTPEAVVRILAVTSGHPYYTQLICHSLFDLWSRIGRSALTAADVDSVLPEVIELGSPNLTYVWADSTYGERALMAALTRLVRREADAVSLARIRKAWRDAGVEVPEPEVTQAIRSLRGREVITGDDAYSFTVDLQRLWIAEHQRLEWVRQEFAGPARGPVASRATGPGTEAGDTLGRARPTWRRPRARQIAIGAGMLLGVNLVVGLVIGLVVSLVPRSSSTPSIGSDTSSPSIGSDTSSPPPATVCEDPSGIGCTRPGEYGSINAVISRDYDGFRIAWASAEVAGNGAYPTYWTAYLTFTNIGHTTESFSCRWASQVQEVMTGGKGNDGYLEATTNCPDPTVSTPEAPGQAFQLSANFHNVPWPGTRVAIDLPEISAYSPAIYPFG
jgi:hypothetical protein